MNAILTFSGELTISYNFDLEEAFGAHNGEQKLQEETLTLPHKVTTVAVGG